MCRTQRPFLMLIVFVGLLLPAASPVKASSLFSFDFSGFVEIAIATSNAGPPKLEASLDGQAFSASFLITKTGSATTGVGSLATNLSGFFGNPNLSSSGISFSGNALLLSNPANDFLGSVGPLSFLYINGSRLGDFLTVQIPIQSVDRADDSGTLDLVLKADKASLSVSSSVSPVPLPPALPLFATALLMLGLFAFRARSNLRQIASSAPGSARLPCL
jgi:hypothetical protein